MKAAAAAAAALALALLLAAAPPAAAAACKSPRCKACDPKTGACYPNQCAAGYGVASAGGCQRCADARCSQCSDGGVPHAGGAAASDARARAVCQTCATGWGLNTKTVGTTTKCTPCKVKNCQMCDVLYGAKPGQCKFCAEGFGTGAETFEDVCVGGRPSGAKSCSPCPDPHCRSCNLKGLECTACMPGYILRSPKGGLPVVGAKNVCARGEPKSETDNYCGEDRR